METKDKRPKDWAKSSAAKSVRAEITASLGGAESLDALTRSRVDEYMDFWSLRHRLQDDVAERGLYVEDDRGRLMENRSVSLCIQASRQMSALASALGLVIGMDRRLEVDDL